MFAAPWRGGIKELTMRAQRCAIVDVPAPLAVRMTALDLDLAVVTRSEPGALGALRIQCEKCTCRDRCEADLKRDPGGRMRYCRNDNLLNFLTGMWWLKTLL
jgi:hypothetical protein